MKITVFSIITLIGSAQGIFLSCILFTIKKGNRRANRIFALMLCAISCSISSFLFVHTGLPILSRLYEPVQFVFGPLLFLYVKVIAEKLFRMRKRDFLHFFPFLLYLGYFSITLLSALLSTDPAEKGSSFFAIYFEIITSLHMWLYIIASLFVVKRYRRRLKDTFSEVGKINLSWMNGLLSGMVFVYSLFLLLFIFQLARGFDADFFNSMVGAVAAAALYYIAYSVILNPRFFNSLKELEKSQETLEKEGPGRKGKYTKSPLTADALERYWKQLTILMEEEKKYLTPALGSDDIAGDLQIPRQYLSQILSECAGSTFYDYVNAYRIKAVKNCLARGEHKKRTLLDLALDAGFNSKTTFNSAFKKNTGMTPTQYIRSLDSSHSSHSPREK